VGFGPPLFAVAVVAVDAVAMSVVDEVGAQASVDIVVRWSERTKKGQRNLRADALLLSLMVWLAATLMQIDEH